MQILERSMLRLILTNQLAIMDALATLHEKTGGTGYHAAELRRHIKETTEALLSNTRSIRADGV